MKKYTEAAIVALPHYLHCRISCELMNKKLHVFCEKPMAITKLEAKDMIACSEENSVLLRIGNIRRFYWSSKQIKRLFDLKEFDNLESFCIEEGNIYDWPTSSGFYFNKKKSGGGVLIDTGAHVIDLLLWWLEEYPTFIKYQDDNFGGVEAECFIQLRFGSSIHGSIKLSRLSKLQNKYKLNFKNGIVVYSPFDYNSIIIYQNTKKKFLRTRKSVGFSEYFHLMLENFIWGIKNKKPFTSPSKSIIPSIQLIEECYENATRLELPWLHTGNSNSYK